MIIFDWNGTLALNNELVEGADQLLELVQESPIFVVSRCRGDHEERRRIIESTLPVPVEGIFITSGEKKPEMMKALQGPRNAIVVGDRIQKEIRDGNALGLLTVWIAGGKYPHEPPTGREEMPDITVWHLRDLLKWPWNEALQSWITDIRVSNYEKGYSFEDIELKEPQK